MGKEGGGVDEGPDLGLYGQRMELRVLRDLEETLSRLKAEIRDRGGEGTGKDGDGGAVPHAVI